MKFHCEGENEKRHNKAILLKSHLTVKSNDLMRTSRRRARGGGGGGGGGLALIFMLPYSREWKTETKCVFVRRGDNIKNNCCLSRL